MDSNQSEQQYYSKLTSNIITPAQYPCTVIGSNKNNIHTIVPNISNSNPLNINVKYQNSNESKLAQSISYNCYSNNANSSFNQNDELKFIFGGAKPKKIPHTKRVKSVINQCIDNSNDITAAPNQLTILVQKVLPAQVPDHHPPLSAAAHISAAQSSLHSVISPSLESVVSSNDKLPSDTIDTITSVINDVITKATSKERHDDVFLSVIKSRWDTSSSDNHHVTFIPPHATTPQFIDVNLDSNHKRPSNISLESSALVNKRSPNKRQRLSEPIFNDNKSYQRCQLNAPNFRKLVHEPRISDKCQVLPPIGVISRRRPCISLDQLKYNCIKYRRVPFILCQPHPRTAYQDRFIVENLNANIPASRLLTSHDIIEDLDCMIAPSPNNNELDYLSVFTSDQVSSPSVNLHGPNLEMLHPPQRTLSPQLSLFHCPNKDYLRLDHPPSLNLSHKYVSTPTSDPLSDTSIVDSETGEMVISTIKPHPKFQLVTSLTVNHANNDDFSIIDEEITHSKSTDFFEMPLYSEKVYKSTSLQWKRKQRETNQSEDCTSINDDDIISQSKDQHPDSIFIGEEPSSVVQVQGSISSKSKDQHIFIGEDSLDSSIVVQVQGSISSKSKQISKRLHIILNDKMSKKKVVSVKCCLRQFKNVKYHNFQSQTLVNTNHAVISESQFIQLSRKSNTIRRLRQSIPDTRQCSFCHQQGDFPESDAGKLLNLDIDKWLHLNCALWCNDVFETQSGALTDIPKSLSAICTVCGKSGAGISCYHSRCTAKYHVPCARENNCHFQDDRVIYCYQHQNQSNDVALRSLSVNRRVYISRNECSQIVTALNQDRRLYIRIGSVTIISIGQLLPHQIHSGHFHNLNHVYPVGFKSKRIHWSSRLVNTRSLYISEILLDNDRPLFKVTATDDNHDDIVYRSHSCDAVWKDILDNIASIRTKNYLINFFPDHIKGEHLFGLTEPNILRLIESLPGFENVCDYAFRYGKVQLISNMPLPLNASGSIRCEPFHRISKHAHKLSINQSPSFTRYSLASSQKQERSNILTMLNSNKWQLYRKLKQDWKSNVILKRSKIQGLGLYAAKDLEKGTMVIEYIGELIRNEVANKREKEYESKKQGVYMFRLDDSTVIDATRAGDLARYINHCCEPNCFTEIVETEKESHIVVISKRKIEKNEELNYDYKFEDDGKEEKIPCLCGARSCRRWMN